MATPRLPSDHRHWISEFHATLAIPSVCVECMRGRITLLCWAWPQPNEAVPNQWTGLEWQVIMC